MSAPATISAQSDTDRPKQYLPEKGDFAVGVDIVPLLKTIGGAFKSGEAVPAGGTPFTYNSMFLKPNVSVMGRYMLTDKWGLKANLGVAVRSENFRSYATDDLETYLDPTSEAKVEDCRKVTQSGMTLTFGAEYRIGSRRVQGIVGFGIMGGFSTFNTSYSYGNRITELNRTPTNSFGDQVTAGVPSGYRITDAKTQGPNGVLGAYASLGAEWFVAPKVSLGAEVDLTFYTAFSAKGCVKSQGYNEAYQTIDTRTDLTTPGDNSYNFGTDNIAGSVYVSFYF